MKNLSCLSCCQEKARVLVHQGVTIVPVIIGSDLKKEDIKPITDDEDRILPVKPTDKPKDVAENIDEQVKKAVKGNALLFELKQ